METKKKEGAINDSKVSGGRFNRVDGLAMVVIVLLLIIVAGMFGGYCQGTPGPAGPQGDPGAAGPPGSVQEVRGPQGDLGPPGEKGARGEQGPSGAPGEAGAGSQGEPGVKGDKGDQGGIGPQGERGLLGEKGDKGDTGDQGEMGPKGEPGFLNPPPTALEALTINHTLLFLPTGVMVENPPAGGMEPERKITQRSLDLRDRQAIRAQFAHDLRSSLVRLSVEYYDPNNNPDWRELIPAFGAEREPYSNQTSQWYALPSFHSFANFFIRAKVYGDGELDPRFTYISLDAK